jgi:ferritin-like metal-binding protein YciE
VQPLTAPAWDLGRRGCHTPYICIGAKEASRARQAARPLLFPVFRRVRQEHRECQPVSRLSAIEHIGASAGRRLRRHVPRQKGPAMGMFTKDIKTMNDLFVHQLQDIYYAEKQLVKALPKMADKASDQQLKQGFLTHLEETKTHVQRLEEVFRMHGVAVKAVDCPAIDGIIEEADEVAGEVEDKSVLDAALINAAQAAEHYEIVRYGSLIAWAKQLGRSDCASVLQKTLEEEKATDKKLNTMAESRINLRAAS